MRVLGGCAPHSLSWMCVAICDLSFLDRVAVKRERISPPHKLTDDPLVAVVFSQCWLDRAHTCSEFRHRRECLGHNKLHFLFLSRAHTHTRLVLWKSEKLLSLRCICVHAQKAHVRPCKSCENLYTARWTNASVAFEKQCFFIGGGTM